MPIVKNYLDKLISVQNVKIERLFEELNGPWRVILSVRVRRGEGEGRGERNKETDTQRK